MTVFLSVPVRAAGSVGYAAHAPVALTGGAVYVLDGFSVRRFSPETNESSLAFSLLDQTTPLESNHPLLYASGEHLWAVVRDAQNQTVLLRRYAPPSPDVTSEYVLRAWPDHGAFVNGRFYYVGVDPSVSIQSSLFALDLNDGSTYLVEKLSLLNFVAGGDYLYYAPYELKGGDGSANSVAFASEPPYPVVRFNTLTGQADTLPFGVPIPEIWQIGNYVLTLNQAADGSFEGVAFALDTGASHVFGTFESNTYPSVVANGAYVVIQSASGGHVTLRVFDASLQPVNTATAAYGDGNVPVAMDDRFVYATAEPADGVNQTAATVYAVPYLHGDAD